MTLSEEQFTYARERMEREGIANQVDIRLQDCRDIPEEGAFDKVSSVGMFEHVGWAKLGEYFGAIRRVLKEDGWAMNHGITAPNRMTRTAIIKAEISLTNTSFPTARSLTSGGWSAKWSASTWKSWTWKTSAPLRPDPHQLGGSGAWRSAKRRPSLWSARNAIASGRSMWRHRPTPSSATGPPCIRSWWSSRNGLALPHAPGSVATSMWTHSYREAEVNWVDL